MTQLRAATFDLDGLMFNTEDLYQESGNIILGRRGKEFTSDLLDQMMGRQSLVALQIMIDYFQLDATPAELADETEAIFTELLPSRLQPMPGLLKLLDALEAAGIPKGIATSSGRGLVSEVLRIGGLADRFEFVLTAEDIDQGKPAPDVYLLAAQQHDIEPTGMLVLEDSQIGCAAAVSAGAFCVAVPHGQSRSHEFPGVRFIADTLADTQIYDALNLSPSS